MEWLSKCPSKSPKVVFRIIDGQAMVIYLDDKPIGNDEVNIFNSTGTRIWELLDAKRKVSEIIKIIYDEFEVDYKTVAKEIMEFLFSLLKKQLITIS